MLADFPDIPQALRIPQAERRASWKGRKLTKPRALIAAPKVPTDPGTIRLLAEIAAREKARAEAKAAAKKEADTIRRRQLENIRSVQRACAIAHNPEGDDTMAKKTKTKRAAKKRVVKKAARREKQVVSRLKNKAGKSSAAVSTKKPPVARAPRNAHKVDGVVTLSKKARAAVVDKAPDSIKPPKLAKVKPPKAESKAAKLEAMLRKSPISAAEIAEQFDWEVHTTRAAITRVGFEITTVKKDGVTLYSIDADAEAKPKKAKAA